MYNRAKNLFEGLGTLTHAKQAEESSHASASSWVVGIDTDAAEAAAEEAAEAAAAVAATATSVSATNMLANSLQSLQDIDGDLEVSFFCVCSFRLFVFSLRLRICIPTIKPSARHTLLFPGRRGS